MRNEHLVPEIIKDMVKKFKKTKDVDMEHIALEARLIAIKEYLIKNGI